MSNFWTPSWNPFGPDQVPVVFDSMPTLILKDSTGGTVSESSFFDPTPVTNYTVIRDDLNAATITNDYPKLDSGYYIGGGYIDWVPISETPTPRGSVSAFLNADSNGAFPEIDLGPNIPVTLTSLINYIPTHTVLFGIGQDNTDFDMKLAYSGSLGDTFTWVRWVFWAVKIS